MTFKNIVKSKTLLFAIGLAALGAIETQIGVLQPMMTKETFGLFSIFIASAMAVLRVLTVVPVTEK